MKLIKRLKDIFPVSLIFAVWAAIVATNYTPGTILSGWDNLHPEFNLPLNISRSLNAFWQEYQGVGLLGGMGHAADLVRQLALLVASPFVPMEALRYSWVFLMLLVGPVGVYFLLKSLTKNKPAALAGSFFYLLNLATVQNFYNPFETFVGFYGFLPWLILGASRYLQNGGKKNLIILGIISLLATPAFYVQTLLVVWGIVFGLFGVETILRHKKEGIKRFFAALAIILVTNSFWLVPSAYFTLTNSSVVTSAKQNVFSTEETQLMNKAFGNLENISELKGYWFEYSDTDANSDKFVYLYEPWREYVSTQNFKIVSYVLFASAFLGVLGWSIFGKGKLRFAPLVTFIISAFCLFGGAGATAGIFDFIKDSVPLFGQIFRSVFTKWSVLMALSISLGLGFFITIVARFLKKVRLGKAFSILALIAVFTAGIYIVKPVFDGNLIDDTMQIKIPDSYFNLFDFFNKQPEEKRIAFFPVQSVWGWNFYNWGYRGSGFLWYGIKQPILDRAFDVWSRQNEQYYEEVYSAVYSNDAASLKRVLEKYDVSYALVDKNVVIPQQKEDLLRLDILPEMLQRIGGKSVFDEGNIVVFEFENSDNFVSGLSEYEKAENSGDFERVDTVYSQNGDYVSGVLGQTVYPFSYLVSDRAQDVTFENDLMGGQYAVVKSPIAEGAKKLTVPAFDKNLKYTLKARVSYVGGELDVKLYSPYEILFDGKQLSDQEQFSNVAYIKLNNSPEHIIAALNDEYFPISAGQTKDVFFTADTSSPFVAKIFDASNKADRISDEDFASSTINNCWSREGATPFINNNFHSGVLNIETSNAVGCTAFKLGDLGTNEYLLNFSFDYKSGSAARPYYCLQVEGDSQCLNSDIFYTTPTSAEWANIDKYHLLSGNKSYWTVIGGRPPEQVDKKWQISYKDPEAFIYPELSSVTFDEIYSPLTKAREISIPNGAKNITIKLPVKESKIDFANAGRVDPINCDVFQRGTSGKKINDDRSVSYTSDDYGSYCDYVSLSGNLVSQDYLLNFVGKNISGRGVRFYLYNNIKGYSEVEGLLSGNEFNQTYSLLSQMHDKSSSDYILNTSVQSFLNHAESKVDNVSLYTAPLSVISKISISGEGGTHVVGKVETSEHSKIGTTIYSVVTRSKNSDGVVVLSQGYDSGWTAFSGAKILKHVKVNGWENGWIVPEGEANVTLFYLPQIMQWISLIGLIGFLGLAVYWCRHKWYNSQSPNIDYLPESLNRK